MQRIALACAILTLVSISACAPASPSSAAPQPTTAAQPPVPAGWTTHTTRSCEYAVSYPAGMQVARQGAYSELIAFAQPSPDAGLRNFLYLSVIDPAMQDRVQHGAYQSDVYNYDPAAADILRGMQVGESKPVSPVESTASGFTFERQPDAQVGGYTAQAYENRQPWEFPAGTKEIRYSVSVEACTYLIGGYVDVTGSSQPGLISEQLFHQIVDTVQLAP